MKEYKAEIWNETGNEKRFLEMMQMKRKRFTKREYDMIKAEAVEFISLGCGYKDITVEVSSENKMLFVIRCHTRQTGSEVWSRIYINDVLIRAMAIAA